MESPSKRGLSSVDRIVILAGQAGLTLDAERAQAVAAVLDAWVPAANRLSERMSNVGHAALQPVTAFLHAHSREGDSNEG
ncbi:hypothetical protein CAL12_21640 [Bordetella genomosp. 8]|uniref:Uncharacterized protein n=1 Tax=Bordetella genomosp. 8 TaxID=1416806 RepID=A0A1W6YQ67_9BORD|nr:hypothetical protein [Bordetella genomosp. 8]ARP83161.1 hypothetical protein CAL12_21640 [Bordetella genomosp. 8]